MMATRDKATGLERSVIEGGASLMLRPGAARWGRWLLALLLAWALWAQPRVVSAQPPAAGQGGKAAASKRGKGKRAAAERTARIRSKRARLLRQRLGLDDARASKVETLFDQHAAAKKKSRRELRTARRALAKLLRQDSDDQAAYRAALDQLTAASTALAALKREHIKQLRVLLKPKEQARLMRMMARAQRHMRRARRRRR